MNFYFICISIFYILFYSIKRYWSNTFANFVVIFTFLRGIFLVIITCKIGDFFNNFLAFTMYYWLFVLPFFHDLINFRNFISCFLLIFIWFQFRISLVLILESFICEINGCLFHQMEFSNGLIYVIFDVLIFIEVLWEYFIWYWLILFLFGNGMKN